MPPNSRENALIASDSNTWRTSAHNPGVVITKVKTQYTVHALLLYSFQCNYLWLLRWCLLSFFPCL